MSALLDIYIKAEALETLHKTIAKKGDKGLSVTVSINDETNKHGQNVTMFVSQTKEQRDAKKEKFYVGNGKVFWMKDGISVAEKKDESKQGRSRDEDDHDPLPF